MWAKRSRCLIRKQIRITLAAEASRLKWRATCAVAGGKRRQGARKVRRFCALDPAAASLPKSQDSAHAALRDMCMPRILVHAVLR